MKTLQILFSLAVLSLGSLEAQTNNNQTSTTTTSKKFWEAQLSGGEYLVDLSRITSVSQHSYMVANLIITEVVIDTDGNSLARFYASTPFTAGVRGDAVDRMQEFVKGKAQDAGIKATPVIKSYPDSTHAKTVEYNLKSAQAVSALYNSVKKAWKNNNAGKFTAK